jgi:hypothetical protein
LVCVGTATVIGAFAVHRLEWEEPEHDGRVQVAE